MMELLGAEKEMNLYLEFDSGGSDSSFMLIFQVFMTSILFAFVLKSRETIKFKNVFILLDQGGSKGV